MPLVVQRYRDGVCSLLFHLLKSFFSCELAIMHVASSWPGVQTCVCLHSALFRWWAIISGVGVYFMILNTVQEQNC